MNNKSILENEQLKERIEELEELVVVKVGACEGLIESCKRRGNRIKELERRRDVQKQDFDEKLAELEKQSKSRSDTIIEYSNRIAELEKETKLLTSQKQMLNDNNNKLCKRVSKLEEECEDYKETLLYCKHNKTGQGVRINGVLWRWSDDL